MYSMSLVMYSTDPTFARPVVGPVPALSPRRARRPAMLHRRGR